MAKDSNTSATTNADKKKTLAKEIQGWVVAILAALTLRWGIAEAYVIPSGSMLPTLLLHDHIFVNKFTYGLRIPFSENWLVQFRKPERGEIIVFKDPRDKGTFLVKRIIGVGGDKIYYHENQLYINDKLIEAKLTPDVAEFNWLRDEDMEARRVDHDFMTEQLDAHPHSVLHQKGLYDREFGPMVIPEDSLFMMGDHRDNSGDSRFFGPVPTKNILGKAAIVWMSCEEGIPGIDMGCNPLTMRWSRTFHWIN